MKSMQLLLLLMLTSNSFGQQEIEYRLNIQDFQELEYKETLGRISNLFAPCATTHSSDGTLLFIPYVEVDNRMEEQRINSWANLQGQKVFIDAECVKIIIYDNGLKKLVAQ